MNRRSLLGLLGIVPLAATFIKEDLCAPAASLPAPPPLRIVEGVTEGLQWRESVVTISDLPGVAERGTAILVESCKHIYVATEEGWLQLAAA